MSNMNRWEPFRGAASLHEHLNRVLAEGFGRNNDDSDLTTWAPAVDILENEHELIVKADVPDVDPKDLGHSRREQYIDNSWRAEIPKAGE